MNLDQALLAAVGGLAGATVFLFGVLMKKNQSQDKRLSDCELDRAALHEGHKKLQAELTDVWKWIAKKNT